MTPLALVPNSALVVRPDRSGSEQATKPFLSRIQKRPTKITCLKPPAITALALAALILVSALPYAAQAAPPGTWSPTGSLGVFYAATATRLASGQVLVAGSDSGGHVGTAYIYNTTSGTFSWVNTLLVAPCDEHTATLLPNGKVLTAGGWAVFWDGQTVRNEYEAAAQLYDPAAGHFSTTAHMSVSRDGHTATLLPNGKVLVAGGGSGQQGQWSINDTSELYDPFPETWSPTIGNLLTARRDHTATLLPNGKVLVAGGWHPFNGNLASAELYDPTLGTWGATGGIGTKRERHTATLLPNGKVLVTGGYNDIDGYLASAELYDPAANGGVGAWSPTGPLGTARVNHTATLLQNGKVLVAGGSNSSGALASAKLYDPLNETWEATGIMGIARSSHAATLLQNGKVLAAGGSNSSGALDSAELYDPQPPPRVKLPALLAFFPFDGDARDASGNGRHGTVPGFGPYLVPGYQGQAYFFNGVLDYIIVPLDINPGNHPRLTMGGWAKKADSSSPVQPIITHDIGGYGRQVGLDSRGGGIGWSAFCGTGGVLGAVPAILDKWTFVAVVYDQIAQTVKLQVDDMMLTKTGVSLGPGDSALYIACAPTFQTYFRGAIDNIFVFGDALTNQQLAYIRSGGAKTIMTAARKIDPGILFLLLMD